MDERKQQPPDDPDKSEEAETREGGSPDRDPTTPEDPGKTDDEQAEEESADSFPASDPPAW